MFQPVQHYHYEQFPQQFPTFSHFVLWKWEPKLWPGVGAQTIACRCNLCTVTESSGSGTPNNRQDLEPEALNCGSGTPSNGQEMEPKALNCGSGMPSNGQEMEPKALNCGSGMLSNGQEMEPKARNTAYNLS